MASDQRIRTLPELLRLARPNGVSADLIAQVPGLFAALQLWDAYQRVRPDEDDRAGFSGAQSTAYRAAAEATRIALMRARGELSPDYPA